MLNAHPFHLFIVRPLFDLCVVRSLRAWPDHSAEVAAALASYFYASGHMGTTVITMMNGG